MSHSRRIAMLVQAAVAASLWTLGAAAQQADEDYRLGPGDRFRISVFGESDLTLDVMVGDSGRISYPFLGELIVEGRTPKELETLVVQGLKGPYLVDPIVTVSVTEHRPFFVHGEVLRAGGIPYQPRLTVERAIALAGGFSERASRRKIEVIRASNPNDAAVSVSLSDPVLPGDIIIVKQSLF